MTTQHCRSCRHHSKETRERFLGVHDGADEIEHYHVHDGSPEDVAAYGPETHEDVFHCTQQGMQMIGIGDTAGVGCTLWQAPPKKSADLPPHLAARIASIEARGGDDGED